MNVIIKNLGNGIKKIIINDPKTYNSLSFKTLSELIKSFKKLVFISSCLSTTQDFKATDFEPYFHGNLQKRRSVVKIHPRRCESVLLGRQMSPDGGPDSANAGRVGYAEKQWSR